MGKGGYWVISTGVTTLGLVYFDHSWCAYGQGLFI